MRYALMVRLSLLGLCLTLSLTEPAQALNPAPCSDDASVRPKWFGFEAGGGYLSSAEDARSRPWATAGAAYHLALDTLHSEATAPGALTPCRFNLDGAVNYVRAGLGYGLGTHQYHALLGDVSFHRILSASWSGSLGVAADYRSFEAGWAVPVGLQLRINFAEWVSLSGRLLQSVAASNSLDKVFSGAVLLTIEPRLYCEHITRERCEPTWFFKTLLN